jgi:hypothetical protein
MEADWEIEIGGGASVIDAHWPGFIDLRLHPGRVAQLAEAADFPALAQALAALNSAASPVWTSKCDLWPVADFAGFDPDELDATAENSTHAMGCYIDLLLRTPGQWPTPDEAIAACKQICLPLGAIPLRCCRVDLIIRRAFTIPETADLGITAYLTSCGRTQSAARAVLEQALAALAHVLAVNSKLK